MEANVRVADGNGKILDAAKPNGWGFRIVPAVAFDSAAGTRPGCFPVRVKFRGGAQRPLDIFNSDLKYFSEAHDGFDIEGAESGDAFVIEEYFHRNSGSIPSGQKTIVSVAVQAVAAAVPTIVPVGAVGFKVRPGTLGHNFYFPAAAGGICNIWVRSKSGNWYDTLSQIDPATEPVAFRAVQTHADRVYLRAAGAGDTVEVDADQEVG